MIKPCTARRALRLGSGDTPAPPTWASTLAGRALAAHGPDPTDPSYAMCEAKRAEEMLPPPAPTVAEAQKLTTKVTTKVGLGGYSKATFGAAAQLAVRRAAAKSAKIHVSRVVIANVRNKARRALWAVHAASSLVRRLAATAIEFDLAFYTPPEQSMELQAKVESMAAQPATVVASIQDELTAAGAANVAVTVTMTPIRVQDNVTPLAFVQPDDNSAATAPPSKKDDDRGDSIDVGVVAGAAAGGAVVAALVGFAINKARGPGSRGQQSQAPAATVLPSTAPTAPPLSQELHEPHVAAAMVKVTGKTAEF